MAADWKAPGADDVKVKYMIVQFASGEWAIQRTTTDYVAWAPTRAKATSLMNTILPANAERES